MLDAIRRAFHRVTYALHRATEAPRSPKWHALEKSFLEEHPRCAACATRQHLQVHHLEPFHLHPELELVRRNLITLCMDRNECHLRIGHGGSWRKYNPNARGDARIVLDTPTRRAEVVARAKALARA